MKGISRKHATLDETGALLIHADASKSLDHLRSGAFRLPEAVFRALVQLLEFLVRALEGLVRGDFVGRKDKLQAYPRTGVSLGIPNLFKPWPLL